MAGFPDGVEWQLEPAGPVVEFEQGPLPADIFEDTSALRVIGPAVSGTAAATTVCVVDGVLRYEVVDWGRLVPLETAVAMVTRKSADP